MEMGGSVDDLKSSRSIKGTHGPDFELLDARIASAMNKIIQNTRFKKKVSLEDQFLRGRHVAYLMARGWGLQGRPKTGGGGLARVPNLRVCKHLVLGGGTRRGREG